MHSMGLCCHGEWAGLSLSSGTESLASRVRSLPGISQVWRSVLDGSVNADDYVVVI